MKTVTLSDLDGLIGTELGTSEWVEVDQDAINAFADTTRDHQFIHVDPEAAKKTPFGGTIAHGFLTLSLLPHLSEKSVILIEGVTMGVNYGFEKIRFLAPVPSGSRIRGHFTLKSYNEKRPGHIMLTYGVSVEIENIDTPALSAEWIVMQMVG